MGIFPLRHCQVEDISVVCEQKKDADVTFAAQHKEKHWEIPQRIGTISYINMGSCLEQQTKLNTPDTMSYCGGYYGGLGYGYGYGLGGLGYGCGYGGGYGGYGYGPFY
ncbi:Coiled-Coil Domain-Containing Protein 18 [Manis pentadactyla]|nr:Coiled-Coil Domain-Containing Protein 18 [Manis pentadactyla]